MNRRGQRGASIYRRWHRFLALAGALFIIFLVFTGTAINHSELLGMGHRTIRQSWLLSWYGLPAPANLTSVVLAGRTLTGAGNRLYLDGQEIATTTGSFIGAVASADLLIVASSDKLLLLTLGGELVERLRVAQIDSGTIEAIGQSRSGLVVIKAGAHILQADRDLIDWQPLPEDGGGVQWSSSAPTPEAIRQQVVSNHQGPGLSLEQLVLDLHSGRFFGTAGIIIYDLLALVLLTVALSGLVLWQRGRHNNRNTNR